MTINEIITEYTREKTIEAEHAKRVKELAKAIMDHAGTADAFSTDDWIVTIQSKPQIRLDTAALYADFPDIKDEYKKVTIAKTIVPARKTSEAVA